MSCVYVHIAVNVAIDKVLIWSFVIHVGHLCKKESVTTLILIALVSSVQM